MKRLLRRTLYTGSAAICGVLLWGANQASAGDEGASGADVDQTQQAGQQNTTDQDGDASIGNLQLNLNLPIAVLSPGANNGDVTQSNTATNTATVSNTNATQQAVDQSQSAASGGGGAASVSQDQTAGQTNATGQEGDADVDNNQVNVNLPIAVLSPGANSGDVTQSNAATNTATVSNTNGTAQSTEQSQSGAADGSGGGGGEAVVTQDQTVGQTNTTDQDGSAYVGNDQTNVNATGSDGETHGRSSDRGCGCQADDPAAGGDVTQSNAATNSAGVSNTNGTAQVAGQSQEAGATGTGDDDRGCGCDDQGKGRRHHGDDGGSAAVDQSQVVDQDNSTYQDGDANIGNNQANRNEPEATEGRWTPRQDGGKGDHGCGCAGDAPAGNGGDVAQTNTATNTAAVPNTNASMQVAGQSQQAAAKATGGDDMCGCDDHHRHHGKDEHPNDGCGCRLPGSDRQGGSASVVQTQAVGQSNGTSQEGGAYVDSDQENGNETGWGDHRSEKPHKGKDRGSHGCGCPGDRAPNSGDVSQSNSATNSASASDTNGTAQAVLQRQLSAVVARRGATD